MLVRFPVDIQPFQVNIANTDHQWRQQGELT